MRPASMVACCAISMLASVAQADNPIVQTVYTTDPAPLVYEGRVYVYTGRDEDMLVNNFFTMNEWRAYSSSDMVNWTDHGSPLRYSDFSWARGDAWAGQVIARNGKFYYYIPTTSASLGRMAIGVAVSDTPIGPFEDALGEPLITEGCGDIDPTVFIDDDEQAYLYWGNPNLCYVRLNDDMISYEGSVVHVPMTAASFGTRSNTERPTTYEEGPWLYKRDGLYYMVFAGGPISEHIGYSTGPSPTGPWTYGGVIMPTQGSSFTNHAGVIDFMGGSYFFYHNGALPDGGGFHRSVCVERFEYRSDGTFPTIDMTDEGAPGVGNLSPYLQTEAETMAWESGVETEACSEGGLNVGYIDDGDYIMVASVDFRSGAVSFDARVASAASGGNIELRLDSVTGTLVGTCSVENTGGLQSWATTTCTVSGATGIHDLYLSFAGGSGPLFNFNWWRFEPLDPLDPLDSGDAGVADAGSMTGGAGGNGGDPPLSGTGGMSGAAGVASGAGASSGGSGATTGGSTAGMASSGVGAEGYAGEPAITGPAQGCACRSVSRRRSDTAPAILLLAILATVLHLRGNHRTRRTHA